MPLGLPDSTCAGGCIDMPLVRFAARRHRIACLLHPWLELPGSDRVTPEAARSLRAMRQRNALRILAFEAVLDDIRQACEGEVSSLLAFKGPSLARQLYGDPLLSRARDLDLLVDPRDMATAAARLLAAGFLLPNRARKTALAGAEWIYRRLDKDMAFVHPRSALVVELHQRRIMIDRLPPFAVAPAAAGSIPHAALDASYAAYLLAHGAQTRWHRLKWLADLTQVWRRLEEAQYRELIGHCERSGIALAARAGLLLAEDVFPRSTPGALLEWANRPSRKARVGSLCTGFFRVLSDEEVRHGGRFWHSYENNPYDSVGRRVATLTRVTAVSAFRRIRNVL